MKTNLTIEIDSDLMNVIEKRAKKNLTTPKELIEDIVRRSMVSYKEGTTTDNDKVDDALVKIFSRKRR